LTWPTCPTWSKKTAQTKRWGSYYNGIMAGITISRQMGSLGRQVATETAQKLWFKLVWRDLINEAAIRAGVPEVALATIDESGIMGLKPSRSAQQAYHQAVKQVLKELAEEGNVVIIGRAGQVILQDVKDFLHVRIVAPKPLRVKRVMEEKKLSLEVAQTMVETSDRNRTVYLRRYYHVDVDDPLLYDLVINTQDLAATDAAEIICAAFFRHTHEKRD
jgi:cytidylate kinase